MNPRIFRTKIGQRSDILDAFKKLYSHRKVRVLCMYNSGIDMIIQEQDQDLMMLPIDDRMANRAHGVAETANIRNYRFSNLEQHLSRMQESAKTLGMRLPMSNEEITNKLHDLAGVAYETLEKENYPNLSQQILVLRLLVSSGSGDFGIYSNDKTPVFYAIVYVFNMPLEKLQTGVHEYTLKKLWTDPDYLANAKTVNYQANSIMADYSKSQGGYIGIKLDPQGFILEGAIANIAYVTKDNIFAHPPLSKVIKGTTLKDAIEVVRKDLIPNQTINDTQEIDIHINQVHNSCKELFFLQNEKIIPIIFLDGKPINDGKVGPICQYLQSQIKEKQQTTGQIIKGFEKLI